MFCIMTGSHFIICCVGSLFAIMSVMASTAMLFSTLTSNKIYAATLFLMEGFIFLIGAGTKLIALFVLL